MATWPTSNSSKTDYDSDLDSPLSARAQLELLHTKVGEIIAGATDANTADAVVLRDGSGNFSAGTITADLTGTASNASAVTVADESADTTCFPLFVTAATGSLAPKSGTNLTFNSSTGVLTATGFAGALTGNVTGNCSGSSGSCTGNSATATTAGASGSVSANGDFTAGTVYYFKNNGVVTISLEGLTWSAASSAASGAGLIPSGYRPAVASYQVLTADSSNAYEIIIGTSGAFTVYAFDWAGSPDAGATGLTNSTATYRLA